MLYIVPRFGQGAVRSAYAPITGTQAGLMLQEEDILHQSYKRGPNKVKCWQVCLCDIDTSYLEMPT